MIGFETMFKNLVRGGRFHAECKCCLFEFGEPKQAGPNKFWWPAPTFGTVGKSSVLMCDCSTRYCSLLLGLC